MFPFQLWKTVLVKPWQILHLYLTEKIYCISSHFSISTMDTDQIERARFNVSKYSRHWSIGCISLNPAMYTWSQSLVVKIIFRYEQQQKCWNKSYCLRNLGILFFLISKEKTYLDEGKTKSFFIKWPFHFTVLISPCFLGRISFF